MEKAFKTIVLLVIIFVSFGYVVLRLSAQGSEDSYFNQNLRLSFAAHPFWRGVLGLHDVGDARDDYLGNSYEDILIEVDVMKRMSLKTEALELLAEKIEAATGKPTSYLVSDQEIPFQENLDRGSITALAAKYRNHSSTATTASLYLLYGSADRESQGTIGLTFREDSMVLFGQTLEKFTEDNPSVLPYYQESTALHEFGHQLGLGHNEEPGCLMTADAERVGVFRERPEDVILDFCDFEKELILEEVNLL